MSFPTDEQLNAEDHTNQPASRRRRQRRAAAVRNPADPSSFLQVMVQRTTPSADFFLYSFLSAVVLAAAVLLDAPALFVMAALIAPYLTPVTGLSVAAALGSFQVFFQGLGALIFGGLLIFMGGAAAGFASRFIGLPESTLEVARHASFTWPDFALLTLGAILTTYMVSRFPRRYPGPFSAALAYELFLPLGSVGFGLMANQPLLITGGLLIFTSYLAWAVLVGAVSLFIFGFRPFNLIGLFLSFLLSAAAIAAVLLYSGAGAGFFAAPETPAVPSISPPLNTTATPTQAAKFGETPQPPKETATPTNTLVPSRTPTMTVSPHPTPLYARINAGEFNGALVRAEPDSTAPVVKSLLNEMLVEVLPETRQIGGITWVRIRTAEGIEGWVVRGLLITATPVPTQ